ncbi:hypothetical protein HDU85_006360 [Gaertneriomyces sp. JEL0708]|nr:hypothetical protein HDU85_006360 [Gaertneriomyces sp. JEL0708]
MHDQGLQNLLKSRSEGVGGTSTSLLEGKLFNAAIGEVGSADWTHCQTLKRHCGCVNALTFSNEKGELMATGGDDQRVMIWRMSDEPVEFTPIAKYHGHASNIFCIAFASTDHTFYSCGNDGVLLKFDLEYSSEPITNALKGPSSNPVDVVLAHEEAALRLSVQPLHDNILLTAGQDFTVKLWDMRCSDRMVAELKTPGRRQNSVAFNPVIQNLFLTADDKGGLYLRDVRMLSRNDVGQAGSGNTVPVQKYATQLQKGHKVARPVEIPSAVWNATGRLIGAVVHRWWPTIYAIDTSEPVCLLKTPHVNGHGFKSAATVKTGSFGDLDGTYFVSGSDDFRAYAWRLPSEAEMKSRSDDVQNGVEVGYSRGSSNPYLPMTIQDATFVLKGHRSIVNSTHFHPQLPLLATAGVEKVVRIFSPFPMLKKDDGTRERQPISAGHTPFSPLVSLFLSHSDDNSTEEDLRTLTFFDLMLDEDEAQDPLWESSSSGSDSSDVSASENELLASPSNVDESIALGHTSESEDELMDVEDLEENLAGPSENMDSAPNRRKRRRLVGASQPSI